MSAPLGVISQIKTQLQSERALIERTRGATSSSEQSGAQGSAMGTQAQGIGPGPSPQTRAQPLQNNRQQITSVADTMVVFYMEISNIN